MVGRIYHVGLTVSDLERSIAFYRDVLGLEFQQSKQTEVRKTTVQANSKEELLDKIKNIDWDSIKPEENKIGGRFDFSI